MANINLYVFDYVWILHSVYVLLQAWKAIAIAENFRSRAINHAWFVYNFEAHKHKECLCWENISIVVINNKIVFFVASLSLLLSCVIQYSIRHITPLIHNNNNDFNSKISSHQNPLLAFWTENLLCSLNSTSLGPLPQWIVVLYSNESKRKHCWEGEQKSGARF